MAVKTLLLADGKAVIVNLPALFIVARGAGPVLLTASKSGRWAIVRVGGNVDVELDGGGLGAGGSAKGLYGGSADKPFEQAHNTNSFLKLS
ncbi:MAG: hypothetical protein NC311_08125 [Muribaculaceae bacterium]|nr:hypothetical protein [Muribaculaceae bacterium]